MEYKSNKTIIMMVILTAIVLSIGTIGTAHAGTPAQNWSVGFTDGCDDGKAGNNVAYYGHPNGNHHSVDYNAGYNAGFDQCKPGGQNNVVVASSSEDVDNSNQNNRNQNQGQSLTNPNSNCFVLIGGCTNQNLQGQSLNN